jgi:hypothetical protein
MGRVGSKRPHQSFARARYPTGCLPAGRNPCDAQRRAPECDGAPDVPLHREEINTEIRDSNRGAATARKALDVLGARLRGCS